MNSEKVIHAACPCCGKRLFDMALDAAGTVSINQRKIGVDRSAAKLQRIHLLFGDEYSLPCQRICKREWEPVPSSQQKSGV